MVKFEGKIGTLYQIFTPCTHCKFCMMFKRKGGGVKGLLNNVKKNCTFLGGWHPLSSSSFFEFQELLTKLSGRALGLKVLVDWILLSVTGLDVLAWMC